MLFFCDTIHIMNNKRIQFILKEKVNEIVNEKKVPESEAFIRFGLSEIFELDNFELDEAITDGGMDKGIDAIFEKDEDGEGVLYVVQSKYFSQNPDKSIDENAKNHIIDAVSNYILGDGQTEYLNERLRGKVAEYQKRIRNGEIDRVEIIFLTNGQDPSKSVISDLERFVKDENYGTLAYQIITEANFSFLFAPESAKIVKSVEIKVVKDCGAGRNNGILSLPDVDILNGRVFKVDVVVLAQVVQENPNIFALNVRAFQSLKNKVNKEIAKTLRDKNLIESFLYLNNGITIVCEDFNINLGGETITFEKPSIINGCQTASTILEVFKEGVIEPNVGFVLVRAVKTRDPAMRMRIIQSSNAQTAIKDRDLISEDEIQKELEREFEELGYSYQRKRGMFFGNKDPKVIDLEKVAQYYFAFFLRKPAEAKNKKKEIYGSYYAQIFHKNITARHLLVGWILFQSIQKEVQKFAKETKGREVSVLRNGVLHLLPLFDEWSIKPSGINKEDFNENTLNGIIQRDIVVVIKKFLRIMKEIASSEGEKFNPQYFFKGGDSLEKILGTEEGTPNYEIVLDEKNYQRRDLRYYKPDQYSIKDDEKKDVTHWNELFVLLINLYLKENEMQSAVDLINSTSRTLFKEHIETGEEKLRKRLENGFWLLTNFDSQKMSRFCFLLANRMKIPLRVYLRPTAYRIEKKLS